jgi:hypothetical protein
MTDEMSGITSANVSGFLFGEDENNNDTNDDNSLDSSCTTLDEASLFETEDEKFMTEAAIKILNGSVDPAKKTKQVTNTVLILQ